MQEEATPVTIITSNCTKKTLKEKVFPQGFFHQRHNVKNIDAEGKRQTWTQETLDAKDKMIEVNVFVEEFRFYFYLVFCIITFIGYVLTESLTADYFGCDKFHKLLTDVFGSLNLCVYFDFPPATYVLPSLYSILVVIVYLYAIASIFRAWISKQENRISAFSFKLYTAVFIYFALSASLFSTIFAVQPNPAESPNTVLIHTIPYSNIAIALCTLQVAVTWFGIKVAWEDLKAPKWLRFCSLFCTAGMVVATSVKIIQHINALGDLGEDCGKYPDWKKIICESSDLDHEQRTGIHRHICGKGLIWSVYDPTYTTIAIVTEKAWVIFTVLFPFAQSGYFWFQRFKTHHIIFSVRDNKPVT